MDFSVIFESVADIAKTVIDSNLIEKIVGLAEKAGSTIIDIVTSVLSAIAG